MRVLSRSVWRFSMRFGITARMAVLAAGLVLLMAGITGFFFYDRAKRVLTRHELEDLGNAACRAGYRLTSDLRKQRVDTWSLAQKEPVSASTQLLDAIRNKPRSQWPIEPWRDKVKEIFKHHPSYV